MKRCFKEEQKIAKVLIDKQTNKTQPQILGAIRIDNSY